MSGNMADVNANELSFLKSGARTSVYQTVINEFLATGKEYQRVVLDNPKELLYDKKPVSVRMGLMTTIKKMGLSDEVAVSLYKVDKQGNPHPEGDEKVYLKRK